MITREELAADKAAIVSAFRAAQAKLPRYRVRTKYLTADVTGWAAAERAANGREAIVTLLCACGCGGLDGEPAWTLLADGDVVDA